MEKKENRSLNEWSRRAFINSSATMAGGALLASTLPVEASAWAGGSDRLKLALVGSGARGAGAVVQALQTDGPVELIAMADIFRDQLDRSYERLAGVEALRPKIRVPEEHKFIGLDAYRHVIELADVVILATPPAFRPLHFKTAVEAGKHVFMEKPLATDMPGIRMVMEAGKLAARKNLSVVVGLQNRYNIAHIELVKRIMDGMIGQVVSANTEYLVGFVRNQPRQPGQTELEFQLRNWRYFNWIWGGAPAGLNIHHSDVVHWVKGAWPVQAHAVGGRAAMSGPDHGDIFDHYYIEYQYKDGTKLHSPIRMIDRCRTNAAFYLQGTEGTASLREGIRNLKGETIWRHRDMDDPNPFQRSLDLFIDSIRNGLGINDTEWGVNSTLASLMGRMAAHSGQIIYREEALQSKLRLVPDLHSFEDEAPVQPDEKGRYPVPVPGQAQVL